MTFHFDFGKWRKDRLPYLRRPRRLLTAAVSVWLVMISTPTVLGRVFNVADPTGFRDALEEAGRNHEGDTIQVLSDMTLSAPLIHTAEDQGLVINGNGHRIDGNEKYRCLEIRDAKVALKNAHVEIHDLTFSGGADRAAGGLLVNYRFEGNASRIKIDRCRFEKNRAKLWGYGWGGGAYIISYDGDIDIRDCQFVGNFSAAGAGGVKIEASGRGQITVRGCRFAGNTSAIWYGGVLVHGVGKGTLDFSRNLVVDNTSQENPAGGAGIWVGLENSAGRQALVSNNVIYGNRSPEVAGLYVWVRGGSRADVLNNTIANNIGNIGLYLRAEGPTDVIEVYNNIVWAQDRDIVRYGGGGGRVEGGFNCYDAGRADVTHEKDVTAASGFMGSGDYHLRPDSPCIDAGFAGDGIPHLDFDGDPRPQGKGIDLGAFEFMPLIQPKPNPGSGVVSHRISAHF
jgi:hypothetical protein